MTDQLKKYLITVYYPSGHVEKEVIEYGRDEKHAKERVSEKLGGRNPHNMSVEGEIK